MGPLSFLSKAELQNLPTNLETLNFRGLTCWYCKACDDDDLARRCREIREETDRGSRLALVIWYGNWAHLYLKVAGKRLLKSRK